MEGNQATLYLDGKPVETAVLTVPFTTAAKNFRIGGDNRINNTQYFKGTVYSLALFAQARTPAQITADMTGISGTEETLLYRMEVATELCPDGDGIHGHTASDWIEDVAPAAGACGVSHRVCTVCGAILEYRSAAGSAQTGSVLDYTLLGKTFETHQQILPVEQVLAVAPMTFETTFQLSSSFNDRGGVLIGNYTAEGMNVINLEIYTNGQPRLYYRVNGAAYTVQFTTDIRSEIKTHLALTLDEKTAKLYVNGTLVETAELTAAVPDVREGFCIGGDARTTNYQNFKGTIHAVHLFSDVRTAEEIAADALMVQCEDNSLIYQRYLSK